MGGSGGPGGTWPNGVYVSRGSWAAVAAAGEGGSESDSGAFARWRKAAGGSKVLGWLVRDKMRDATSQAARLRWGIVRQHALLLAMRRRVVVAFASTCDVSVFLSIPTASMLFLCLLQDQGSPFSALRR